MITLSPRARLMIPDGLAAPEALRRTTHLGIGAHQDDLEFMAFHGILACYERSDHWFGGVTITDGRGSSRAGKFKDWTDDQIAAERIREQEAAAVIGQYAFMAQLGFASASVRDARETADGDDLGPGCR
jgi:LmbE family N-acetylglucosaminyl deacetylase